MMPSPFSLRCVSLFSLQYGLYHGQNALTRKKSGELMKDRREDDFAGIALEKPEHNVLGSRGTSRGAE
jgi:hypothetical protein